MSPSDDELIARYLEGELAAFEVLYGRYSARLLGFMLSLGAPLESAEDLAQKAWIKVLDSLKAYRPQDCFRPWLFKIAHRLWVDELRANQARGHVSLEELEYDPPDSSGAAGPLSTAQKNPRTHAASREERSLVEEALEVLPLEMRETVLLRIDGDLKYREIAEAMGCPLGTVLWRMKEAVRRLQEQLAG